jgi:hypothetical protein
MRVSIVGNANYRAFAANRNRRLCGLSSTAPHHDFSTAAILA